MRAAAREQRVARYSASRRGAARLRAIDSSPSSATAEALAVDDLFADATSRFVDGDYKGANKKLNQIWSAIN